MNRLVRKRDDLTIDFKLNSLVIQPTSLCNLNCAYCYLPDRKHNRAMPATTASRLADQLTDLELPTPVRLIWHSGEPLSIGLQRFTELLKPFESLRREGKVRHSIQTNAVLINENWCELFLNYRFTVGVSLDGPRSMTSNRVDWKGDAAYDRILAGIDCLKRSQVSFGVICVVTQESIGRARELYDFFVGLGCKAVAFNVVEMEGVNKNVLVDPATADTTRFWAELLDAWMENPVVEVREFRKTTVWLHSEVYDRQSTSIVKDIIPSVGSNGDVVLVSPEFLGMSTPGAYTTFVVGNVLTTPLSEIISRGLDSDYIRDFISGIDACERECEYFGFCRGGDASNKFFELGRLDATETSYCRSTKKNLVDAVMLKLGEGMGARSS